MKRSHGGRQLARMITITAVGSIPLLHLMCCHSVVNTALLLLSCHFLVTAVFPPVLSFSGQKFASSHSVLSFPIQYSFFSIYPVIPWSIPLLLLLPSHPLVHIHIQAVIS